MTVRAEIRPEPPINTDAEWWTAMLRAAEKDAWDSGFRHGVAAGRKEMARDTRRLLGCAEAIEEDNP